MTSGPCADVKLVTGKKARYVDLPLEDAPKELVFTAELAKLWKYARDNRGRFFGVERELDTARALKRLVCESIGEEAKGLKTWKEWVKENLVK